MSEIEIEGLEGYRGAKPVRAANAARTQVQLDVYRELLDLAWRWHDRSHSPDDDYRSFLVELVKDAGTRWKDPDRGIWELRGEPPHFVFPKAMCWVALDCGIRLAEELGRSAPVDEWKEIRAEMREVVEEKGYDSERGVFIQAFDHPKMDEALLLQLLYSIRIERLLMEQLDYNLLFRWFVGLSMDDSVWSHSVFSKNRNRLLESEVSAAFFDSVCGQARQEGLLSDEHFTVDGTLVEAWASLKSFQPKGSDGPDGGSEGKGRNAEVDFRGQKR